MIDADRSVIAEGGVVSPTACGTAIGPGGGAGLPIVGEGVSTELPSVGDVVDVGAGKAVGVGVAVEVSTSTGVGTNAIVGSRTSAEDEQPIAIDDTARIDRSATIRPIRCSNPSNLVSFIFMKDAPLNLMGSAPVRAPAAAPR